MPRRKPGALLPLESEILTAALSMTEHGDATFHGFALAQAMREGSGSRSLVAHGTLYKALGRLEEFGLLTSRWDDAATGGRPRRRLYQLTESGREAAQLSPAEKATAPRARVAPRHA